MFIFLNLWYVVLNLYHTKHHCKAFINVGLVIHYINVNCEMLLFLYLFLHGCNRSATQITH